MINKDQILAALKKLGPSSPTAIANSMGVEPGAIGYHLRNLLKAKSIRAAGVSNSRVYALLDQDLEGAKAAPQGRKKPKKAGRRKSPKAARPRPAAAKDSFLAAITADNSLVLVHPAQAAQIFNAEQTQAIADLLVQHFEV